MKTRQAISSLAIDKEKLIYDWNIKIRVPLRRLPLTALRTFEVAARRLSFKDAANELCVSPTTVSNQIRQLEKDWKCQLFIRKTRAVVLTDAGRSLSRVLSRAFNDIQVEINGHMTAQNKVVTLAVGPAFGSRWLIPRLSMFRQLYPRIELVLHHSPRITSHEQMQTDIAIDWGEGGWSGLDASHLMNMTYSPVVSPSLLDKLNGLEQPADLSRYPIIHQHDRIEWQSWLRLAGCDEMDISEESIIVDSNVALQAALDGHGVVLGIFPFVETEIEAKRLVQPFPLELHPSRSFHILTKPGGRAAPEIDTVCKWIEAEAVAD
jgi:LysR family transcriptional regulator, glycine cleavage system transcriptional activator